MDGCDPECKYEFAHRFTSIQLFKDVDVPKWCNHRNNRLASAVAEYVGCPGMVIHRELDVINRHLNERMAGDEAFYVLHVLNSDDTSMTTVDAEITVGLYQAHPSTMPDGSLDELVLIKSNQLEGFSTQRVRIYDVGS